MDPARLTPSAEVHLDEIAWGNQTLGARPIFKPTVLDRSSYCAVNVLSTLAHQLGQLATIKTGMSVDSNSRICHTGHLQPKRLSQFQSALFPARL